MAFDENSNVDQILITESSWIKAAEAEKAEILGLHHDDMEAEWGLQFIGYAYDDISSDYLQFLITDKNKYFLAKIKHGF